MSWTDCVPGRTVVGNRLYLRAALDGKGNLLQTWAHDPSPGGSLPQIATFSINDGPMVFIAPAGGQNVVLPVGQAEGWHLYVQRTAHLYAVYHIAPSGEYRLLREGQFPHPDGTSQGFLEWRDGQMRFTDQNHCLYANGTTGGDLKGRILVRPNRTPDGVWFGQHPYDPPRACIWRASEPTVLRVVFEGYSYEPHIAVDPDGSYRCVCRPALERIVRDINTLPTLPLPTEPPPNDPPKEDPPPMRRLTSKEREIIAAFAERFGLPAIDGTNQAARAWTRKVAEQLAFSVNPDWGTKDPDGPDGGRPLSTDVIAIVQDGLLVGYDLILSQGTDSQRLIEDPEPLDLSGQYFVTVTPTNHLGTEPPKDPPDKPPVVPPDYSTQLGAITELLKTLLLRVQKVDDELSSIRKRNEELTTLTDQRIQTAKAEILAPVGKIKSCRFR